MKNVAPSFLAVGLAAGLVFAGSARADTSPFDQPGGLSDKGTHDRKQMLSVWAFLPYTGLFGIGLGGRYTLPLLKDGFIDGVNDSVELELGADVAFGSYSYYYSYSWTELIIPVEARWTFHFTPKFDGYGKLGLGANLIFTDAASGLNPFNFYYNFALGALYHLTDTFALRGEFGYGGLKLGVGWSF